MSTFTIRVTSSATNTAGTNYGQQPDLGAPSFLDMIVSGSSDPMLPNGTYDAYCLNPLLDILLSPTTHTADGASSTTLASYGPIGFSSLTSQQVDQVNWLLSQNFTADTKYGGQFNYGEVQTAIWRLMGFTEAEIANAGLTRFLNDNNRNVVSAADIDFLIQSAQNAVASGNGVVPTDTYFAAVINPAGDVQPLIVQLQSAKLGNYVWADTDADGIQDSGETGINNVIVELYDANGALIASTVTGDDFSTAAVEQGYYQFTGLKAGDYQVKFIAPAGQFISQQDASGNTLDATDSDADVVTGFTQLINLSVGESDQTIDAGLYQKASLGDYVWVDTNNDGQQNDGNTGLNGVTVNLYDGDGNFVATTVTANNDGNPGYYLFDNLTPGDYSVEFVKPAGYEFAQQDQGADGSDSDADVTTGRTISTTLVSGENDLSWDAGLVLQVIPASLGDYVWVDSNNDGQQNDGAAQGLNGVTVNLKDSNGNTIATRVTGNDGMGNPGYYLFDNLTPGDYSVEFVKPTGYAFAKQDQGADGSDSDVNAAGQTIVTTLVSGENDLSWDAGVVKLASLGDRVWEDTNANGVQDNGETGIGNVTVELYDCVTNLLLKTTTTDGNGNYSFTDLTPGTYHVKFVAPNGYVYSAQDVTAENLGTDSDADSAGITACYVVNAGDTITTVDAGLYQKASLGDYVWVDSNNDGQQNDGAAQGLNGVTVNLKDSNGNTIATRVTGNDGMGNPGYYLFDNLTPGDYSVEFVKPTGYAFAKQDQGADGSDSDVNAAGQTIVTTLVSGENDLSWDAGVVKLASLGDRVWEDTNANGVQDNGETGIGNVTVELYDCVTNLLLKTTTTDGNGNYSFTDLTPGTYHVKFVAPNGYVYSAQDVTAENLGTDSDADSAGITACYVVNAGDTITTVDAGLYQKASLGDYVWVDSNNDGLQNDGAAQGLNGVTVNLKDSNGNTIATRVTGNDGMGNPGYYLFDNLTPGDYSVEFVKPTGYAFAKQDQGADGSDSDVNAAGQTIVTTLVSGENDLSWDAGVVKLASLGDRVWEDTNANGVQDNGETGIGNVTVELYDCVTNLLLKTTTTDGNGNYSFTDLTPGTYHVKFVAPNGYVYSAQDVTAENLGTDSDADSAGITACYVVNAGDTITTVDAGLYQTASLGDRIWYDTNANGIQDTGENGVAGVSLSLMDGNQNVVSTTVTDGNGYYRFDNLTPGDYQVNIDESTLPAGYEFTTSNQGGDDAKDSDIIDTVQYPKAWGRMDVTTLSSGEVDLTWDAGIVQLLPGIDIEKTTNGSTNTNTIAPTYDNEDAANGAGVPILTAGSDVTWTYKVTNTGNTSFANSEIAIVDDNGTAANTADDMSIANGKITYQSGDDGDSVLEAGESWIYKATGTVQSLNTLGSATTINMAGSSSTDGSDGNSRSYSANGVTVNASAWSREKGGDTWAKAWLGTYGGGLGVTDSGEGSGGSDSHSVDNNVRDNYIVFQFSQDVVVDKAFLGYVVGDSDMTVYVGSSTTSITSMNNAVLNGMTLKEFNDTSSTSARWADFNAGNVSGNVLILAARDDGHSMDYFKVEQLVFQAVQSSGVYANTATVTVTGGLSDADLSHYKTTSAPPPALKSSIGDKVWVDTDSDGVQDSGEAGVAGVTVKLLNSAGNVLSTTTTNASGEYLFSNLDAGDYAIQVVAPTGYAFTSKDLGGNDETDSDVDTSTGKTVVTTLSAGENDMSWDAGLKLVPTKASIGDKVWHDANFDGIQNSYEVGIANVTVKLLNSAGSVIATTTTNSAGEYLFSNLNPGDYRIQVVKPSGYYTTKKDATYNTLDSDVDSNGYTVLTNLVAGENDMSWDAGLYKKASIGDKVWEDKDHDDIQDSTEPGIANVKVMLQNSSGVTIATTYTNSYGNYKFTNLDPGTYRLVFDKSNVSYNGYSMNNWMWASKNIGSNDSIDSDVNGDGVSKHNVAYTDYTTLTSGENDMTWDAAITPIVIDLNGDGIKTISRANSDGTFDLFGNGGAVNSGWLSGEDGFLAVDTNGNGKIDDITEMFGGLAKGDGFAKLASYDSNGDGVVDASDAAFASLKIWQDANGNHQTDAGELVSLTEAGVASLTVGYTELPFVDAQGNLHLERSNATLADGSSVDMTDVYFNVSAEDAAAANVELASLGQLVGDDSGLDGLLAGLGGGVGMGMSSCANAEMFDTAALDNLSRMAALYEEQAACCA